MFINQHLSSFIVDVDTTYLCLLISKVLSHNLDVTLVYIFKVELLTDVCNQPAIKLYRCHSVQAAERFLLQACHSVGSGVLMLAQKSGYPVIPIAVGLTRFWELRSWDRFRIPKPFSKGYNCWGEPLHVPAEADESTLNQLGRELRARLIALERHADKAASARP